MHNALMFVWIFWLLLGIFGITLKVGKEKKIGILRILMRVDVCWEIVRKLDFEKCIYLQEKFLLQQKNLTVKFILNFQGVGIFVYFHQENNYLIEKNIDFNSSLLPHFFVTLSHIFSPFPAFIHFFRFLHGTKYSFIWLHFLKFDFLIFSNSL